MTTFFLTQRRRDAMTQRKYVGYFWLSVAAVFVGTCVSGATSVVRAEGVSFKRDVAPVLLNNCLACHGPKKAEAGYRIDTFERLTAAGDSTQPGFAAKDLDGSEAFRRITSTDVKERMPLEGDSLPDQQVA